MEVQSKRLTKEQLEVVKKLYKKIEKSKDWIKHHCKQCKLILLPDYKDEYETGLCTTCLKLWRLG